MEQFHADMLTNQFGVPSSRVHLLGTFDPHNRGLEIEDPFGESDAVYQQSYDLIRDCIVNYLDNQSQ